MPNERLELLMKTFDAVVRRHEIFREVYGVIWVRIFWGNRNLIDSARLAPRDLSGSIASG